MADKTQTGEQTSEIQIPLEEARLQIGDQVQLHSQRGDGDFRYSVRLIGISKGRSVLVSSPMEDGKYLLMREGQPFILRTFSGKNAYAFTTLILKSVNTPYPYLHLAYPKEVRSLVVRRGARADVRIVCAIVARDDAQIQAAGVIVNISVGGALMLASQPPGEKDQRLTLKFKIQVNDIEVLLKLDAIIRSVNFDSSTQTDTPYNIGLQFVDVLPETSIPLLAFVYNVLLEQSLGN